MKRRLLAVLLTIALMMTLIPAALAEETENSDSSVTVEVTGDENTTVDPGEGENTDPSAPAEGEGETTDPVAPTEGEGETTDPAAPTEGEGETTDPVAPTEGEGETTDPAAPTESEGEATDPAVPTTPETPEVPETPETPENPEEPVTPEQPAEEPLTDEQLEEYYQQWLSDPDSGVKGLTDAQMQQLNDYINVKQGEIVIPKPEQPVTPVTVPEFDVEAAYEKLLACETEEEIEAFLSGLNEDELEDLQAYVIEIEMADYEPPETVVFTDAGPFMPAVEVERTAVRRLMRAAASSDDNGLVQSKTVMDNDDGTYTITLDAYTTGTVITSTKTVPVDIVLVLDQSGSMAYDFSGNSRQHAMKQAVNNFIDAVAKKYSAEADHRMAIVTFGSDATTLQGWTYVNDTGKATLQSEISGLPDEPSGGTQTDDGMALAEELIGSNYNYGGSNTTRQKVVILFTDGVPGQSGFDTDVADAAISSAYRLKENGATIYTIGIFGGANVDQLYDDSIAGNVGDSWSGLRVLFWGDVTKVSVPAANRFLNYLSSNFLSATELGLEHEEYNIVVAEYEKFTITKNFDRSNTGYYLTAGDSNSLNNIFQTISENIQTANIDLGSATVVQDIVTPYFNMPSNTSSIHRYTADAKADGSFEERVAAPDSVTAKIVGDTVSVTGFDYNANCVTDKVKDDGTYGKKLIIEFTITPKAEFWGGNNVPTNGANSGVYDKDGAPVEYFDNANQKVDVAIKIPAPVGVNRNIYYGGNVPEAEEMVEPITRPNDWRDEFINGISYSVASVSNTEDETYTITATATSGTGDDKLTGTSSCQTNVYVYEPSITVEDSTIYLGNSAVYEEQNKKTVEWKHGDTVAEKGNMYGNEPEITYMYKPAASAFEACTDVTATTEKVGNQTYTAASDTFTVHVLKPSAEVTLTDTTCYYGDEYTPAGGSAVVSWTDGNSGHNPIPEVSGEKPFDNKDVYFKYYKETSYTTELSPFVMPNKDQVVYVKAYHGTDKLTVTKFTTTCEVENFTCASHDHGYFTVHPLTCTLTITKDGCNESLDPNQSFIFTVNSDSDNRIKITELMVTVQENGSVTIEGLPTGTYTVTEDSGWSWRYQLGSISNNGEVQLSKDKNSDAVTITNTRPRGKWLDGNAVAVNNWNSEGTNVTRKSTRRKEAE